MNLVIRQRPSPGMVVACVALSFALAGSAVAGTGVVTSKLDQKEKRQVKRIAKRQAKNVLSQREASLNVNSAKTATTAQNATNAAKATTADNADLLDNLNSTDFLSSAPGAVGPDNLGPMPGARARATVDQTITSAGLVKLVGLDTEDYDTGSMYSPPADALVASRTGTYVITGEVNWEDADPDPNRQIALLVNGTAAAVGQQTAGGTGVTNQTITTLARVDAGDQITLGARQQSGSDLTFVNTTGVGFAMLAAQWLAP